MADLLAFCEMIGDDSASRFERKLHYFNEKPAFTWEELLRAARMGCCGVQAMTP